MFYAEYAYKIPTIDNINLCNLDLLSNNLKSRLSGRKGDFWNTNSPQSRLEYLNFPEIAVLKIMIFGPDKLDFKSR